MPQRIQQLEAENKRQRAGLLAQIDMILEEDQENHNYGIQRMYEAVRYHFSYEGSQSTVARVMRNHGLIHTRKHAPQSLTKPDPAAQKADDLLRRDFTSSAPNEKWITDITQIPTADGPLYLSGIFDCYDNHLAGLKMANHMRKELVVDMLSQAMARFGQRGVIVHSDRGSQYTSHAFRQTCEKLGILQSMNSAGGRCHDNAKCESMWARAKVEKFYRCDTSKMDMPAVMALAFRYFWGYWNNRRICSANGGLPPSVKRYRYYQTFIAA